MGWGLRGAELAAVAPQVSCKLSSDLILKSVVSPLILSTQGVTQCGFHFWKITVVLGGDRTAYFFLSIDSSDHEFARSPGGATVIRSTVS